MERTKAAGLSTRPGQTGRSVSLERQVAPQSILLSWGHRTGQNRSCRLRHRCLERKLMQCALARITHFGDRRFNVTFENRENLRHSEILLQDTEPSLLPQCENVPALLLAFLKSQHAFQRMGTSNAR